MTDQNKTCQHDGSKQYSARYRIKTTLGTISDLKTLGSIMHISDQNNTPQHDGSKQDSEA